MKKYFSVAMLTICAANTAHALTVLPSACLVSNIELTNPTTGCTRSITTINCGGVNYYDCTSCESGYTLGQATVTDPQNSSQTYTYGNCTKDFSGGVIETTECPEECPSTTEWTETTRNREAICNGSLLNKSCSYRCIKGYYQGELICTRCPSSGGIYGTTAAAGATSITECYIPAGTTRSFSDDTGSGTEKFTSNCYYSE